ncbi:MAG: DUF4956 domain-containing protein [bacterium]|nr:DUF4956 domain-containing protein [bacterium]MCM1423695.1 DUF4956 domain-containing protein [bacterium]
MSVKNVIKNSVYEAIGGNSGLEVQTILLILLMACLVGIYIFMVYKLTAKAAFYSRDLNVAMALLPVIVAAIMLAMQSSLLVSLGMVGALSIVRFRNAVKNPIDLAYLFWAISAGIIIGVDLYVLGILLCIIMTLMLVVLNRVPNVKAPDLLVLRSTDSEMDYDGLYQKIGGHCKYYKEKARCVKNGELELIIEVRAKDKEALLQELYAMKRFVQVNCISHDGECRV